MSKAPLRNISRRKTKIVATIGPASSSAKTIRELIQAGMNVARLNFSHGTHEDHGKVLKTIREEAKKLGETVCVFQDLCGPKVRISPVARDEICLVDGQTINLAHGSEQEGNTETLYIESFDPVEVMHPGERALLADGRIELIAKEVKDKHVVCRIQAGGPVRSRSGIAVPDSQLTLPCLTEKDVEDLSWALKNDIDYIALSFVTSVRDIHQLQDTMKELGKSLPVIAKIERRAAVDSISEIVGAADAVMVARGDLGLELPLERVPIAQKFIIEQANLQGTPVITATQMLQSMVAEVRPTRAEVSDVCTAVLDGTDAVMLSEETAIGKHPVKAVEMLHQIATASETECSFEPTVPRWMGSDHSTVPDAVCYAACGAASKVSASAIIACTQSGTTARLIAKYRPYHILFGASSEVVSLQKMALYWGIQPIHVDIPEGSGTEDEVVEAMCAVRDQFGIKPGSRVVLTAGLRAKKRGSTSLMEIREVPRS